MEPRDMPREPYRLREWSVSVGRLFSCGRPGRSEWRDALHVPDEVLRAWVQNLPEGKLVIVSLLGKKPNGKSEYAAYPFRGECDPPDEGKPTFQKWLVTHFSDREITVREHPTVDYAPIPCETLREATAEIRAFLQKGATVVVMDSGGVSRSGAVCGAVESSVVS